LVAAAGSAETLEFRVDAACAIVAGVAVAGSGDGVLRRTSLGERTSNAGEDERESFEYDDM
jgi:hypothetical protein